MTNAFSSLKPNEPYLSSTTLRQRQAEKRQSEQRITLIPAYVL